MKVGLVIPNRTSFFQDNNHYKQVIRARKRGVPSIGLLHCCDYACDLSHINYAHSNQLKINSPPHVKILLSSYANCGLLQLLKNEEMKLPRKTHVLFLLNKQEVFCLQGG